MRAGGYGTVVAGLAAAGVAVSGYLSWHKVFGGVLWCIGGTGCDVVNASPYAEIMGIPVAVFGLGTYVVLLGLGLAWRYNGAATPIWVPLASSGLSLAGWVFSVYLTWVEAFVLRRYCMWCLISLGMLTLLMAVSIWGTLQHQTDTMGD